MKLKLFAALSLFAIAVSTQAANVSINDITIMPGTLTVDVPILVTPTANEMVGAGTISFAAGAAGELIGINFTGDEFDGSIWEGASMGFTGFASTPSVHSVVSIATTNGDIDPGPGTESPSISPDGILITYKLNTSGLAPGFYELDPSHLDASSLLDAHGVPVTTIFSSGTLAVIPEPSTVVLTAIFGVLGLGVYFKRRRG
jgi:hypothetical protein